MQYGDLLCKSPYLVKMREKYGPEKLRIRILFMQFNDLFFWEFHRFSKTISFQYNLIDIHVTWTVMLLEISLAKSVNTWQEYFPDSFLLIFRINNESVCSINCAESRYHLYLGMAELCVIHFISTVSLS